MSATRIGRGLGLLLATAVLLTFPAARAEADDLFSKDGFSRILGTPQVPVPPGGNVPSLPAVPGGRSLQPAELSDFLKSAGLQPETRGPGVCLVQMVRDKWTIPTLVVMDPESNVVAIISVLVTLEKFTDLPPSRLLEMIQLQGELGKRSDHFFNIAKDVPRISLCCVVANRNLEPTRFRAELDDVISSAVKAEAVWNKAKWSDTPGSGRPTDPNSLPQAPQSVPPQAPQPPGAPQATPAIPQAPQVPTAPLLPTAPQVPAVPQAPLGPANPGGPPSGTGPQQPSQLPYWLRPISQPRPTNPSVPASRPPQSPPVAQFPAPPRSTGPNLTPSPSQNPVPSTVRLVGRWLGTVSSSEAFGLVFQQDGTFDLVHTKADATHRNSGRYAFDGRTLRMEPTNGTPIVAVCTWMSADRFRFRLTSEPESENGLVFDRMEP